MEQSSLLGTVLLILTGLVTYKGFRDRRFFEENLFAVDPILIDGEYRRILTSGFLHANWIHFGFNMIALLSFSFSLEQLFGVPKLAGLYLASLIGGSLLALYIHRNHGDYRAVGASGAISGVVLSSIVLFPDSTISFVIIPIEIKSWIFGLLFILISIFGIKSQRDNIGHEAHLGGGLIGILLTPFFAPKFMEINWTLFLALLLPVGLFLLLIIRNPAILMVDGYWGEQMAALRDRKSGQSPSRMSREEELDQLLQKIRRDGLSSLSKKERDRLEELRDEV